MKGWEIRQLDYNHLGKPWFASVKIEEYQMYSGSYSRILIYEDGSIFNSIVQRDSTPFKLLFITEEGIHPSKIQDDIPF